MRVRTDVCGSFRLFFVCAQQCAQTALLTAAHRRRCACAQTAHRLRTDCAQTAHRCAQQLCASSPTSVRIFTALICNFVLIIQFLTDLIPHRHSILCASVRIRCACAPSLYSVRNAHSHCAPTFYDVRILCAFCAHTVRNYREELGIGN